HLVAGRGRSPAGRRGAAHHRPGSAENGRGGPRHSRAEGGSPPGFRCPGGLDQRGPSRNLEAPVGNGRKGAGRGPASEVCPNRRVCRRRLRSSPCLYSLTIPNVSGSLFVPQGQNLSMREEGKM